IRFSYNGSYKIEDLVRLNPLLYKEYPETQFAQKRQLKVNEELKTGEANATLSAPSLEDYVYISADKKRNFKITLDRLNYNVNETYSGWDTFIAECKRLWNIYTENFFHDDIVIKGISIRFINKITINGQISSPSEVFNVSISATPEAIPEAVNNYLVRYVIPFEDGRIQANVMQSLEQFEQGIFPFVLDIDIIQNEQIDNNKLWDYFDNLRIIKNQIFFSTISESTLNQYL